MKKILTMTLLLGLALGVQAQKQKKQEPAFSGYLFAYFEGGGDKNLQEQLRFAVSEDAVNWYALNDNRPIITSDSISESGGIRDPHILRGEDGCYYIVATDMFVMKYGWKENPGIVLLKSFQIPVVNEPVHVYGLVTYLVSGGFIQREFTSAV
jgi:hypothetical protein